MTDRTKGYLLGALSAASYGVNPFAVIMYEDGLTIDSVLCYRYIMAAILTGMLMIIKHESFKISIQELTLLFILGILFSLSSISLFSSYQYIDVSIASTLLFCYPAMVALIMMLIFKEKPNIITMCSIILVGIGIVLLNSGGKHTADNLFGVAIVILSSLVYAIYIVSVQKTRLSKMSSLKVGFYSILFGSIIYIVRLRGIMDLQVIESPRSWVCAIVLAVFPTLISITALAKAIKYIGSTATAILGALEPVTAVLLGVIVFSERPSALSLTGMSIIFGAVTLLVATPKLTKLTKKLTSKTT